MNRHIHASLRIFSFGSVFRSVVLCSLLQAALGHAQQPLTLEQAIRTGLVLAPQARTGADQVELQRAQITGARLRPNPRFYSNFEDLRPWADDYDFTQNTEDYGYLSYTFELDGKRGRRIRYAESGLRRTEAQRQFQLRQLAAAIANAYWGASAARSTVGEWQKQLDGITRLVQYQADRVQAGAAPGVDLLRTQIERDRVLLSLAQAQRTAEAAGVELARLTATPSFRTAVLTDPLEAEGAPVPELPIGTVIEQRPDVAAAREAVTEAKDNVTLQHAYGVPDLDILGGYKRNLAANTAYGGLQYDLPIFNRNQGGVATARAGQQLADDQLAFTRLAARSEITIAVADYHREQGLVRTNLPGMGERAAQNAAIIQDAYRTGGTDLLRLLDAERTLIETRLLAIQTWYAYRQAAIALRLAYGEQP